MILQYVHIAIFATYVHRNIRERFPTYVFEYLNIVFVRISLDRTDEPLPSGDVLIKAHYSFHQQISKALPRFIFMCCCFEICVLNFRRLIGKRRKLNPFFTHFLFILSSECFSNIKMQIVQINAPFFPVNFKIRFDRLTSSFLASQKRIYRAVPMFVCLLFPSAPLPFLN